MFVFVCFVQDVRVDRTGRHLVLYRNDHLRVLAAAASVYMDATFEIVQHPFMQLFSLHAYTEGPKGKKQLPLAYAFMSSRRTIDYTEVCIQFSVRIKESQIHFLTIQ